MAWTPEADDEKMLKLIMSMSLDSLMGRGVDTKETYLSNLEMVINEMRTERSDGSI